MMKKLVSLLLAGVLCIGLTACSEDKAEQLQALPDALTQNATTQPTGTENQGVSGEEDLPYGNEIGDLCFGYDLPIITGDGPTGSTINPVTINPADPDLVTVINFWGTWCGPCKEELPYFDQIAREDDNVLVVAIHGGNVNSNEAYGYIAENYASSFITFAADYMPEGGIIENGYATTLGGGSSYPYTLVLNNEGVITEIFEGMITYNQLKAAVDAARQ